MKTVLILKISALISKYTRHAIPISMSALTLTIGPVVSAAPLIYTPVNPSFGGNPLNGVYLLGKAQATNSHTAPSTNDLSGTAPLTPLEQFNNILQSSILNRLAASATASILNPDGTLKPGIIQTGNFTITIIDAGGGLLNITTTDKSTGATTSFQVSK